MIYSRTCQYAIWAMMELARKQGTDEKKWVKAEKVAEAIGLPFPMTAKVLQMLAHAQLLSSVRGPTGGFRLRKAPKDVRLIDIMMAIDGPALLEQCVLRLRGCNDESPCPFHRYWSPLRDRLRAALEQVTLADLVKTTVPATTKKAASTALAAS